MDINKYCAMTPDTLLQNISSLPPIARREVFDFIEFLLKKYPNETPEVLENNTDEISTFGKEFIDARLEKMQTSSQLKNWEEIRDGLLTEKNW